MDFKQIVLLALQVSIIATVLGFGLRTTTASLAALLRRPGFLARALVSMFVVMPLVVVALVKLFDFPPLVEVLLVALAISPVPPLLPQREARSGGNAGVGVGLMAFLAVASLAAVPAIVAALELVFVREFALPTPAIIGMVAKVIIAPLAVGIVLRAAAPAAADQLAKIALIVSKVLLPLAALVLLAGTASALWAAMSVGAILALSLFVIAGLIVGHFLGGPDPDESVVLALSTACRHPAIAFTIAASNAPHQPLAGPLVLYLLLNLIVAIPYVQWIKARIARPVPAG